MNIRALMSGDGGVVFEADFQVPPVPGDVLLRSDGETVRQRWRVVERRHIFEREGESVPCFIVVEPA